MNNVTTGPGPLNFSSRVARGKKLWTNSHLRVEWLVEFPRLDFFPSDISPAVTISVPAEGIPAAVRAKNVRIPVREKLLKH